MRPQGSARAVENGGHHHRAVFREREQGILAVLSCGFSVRLSRIESIRAQIAQVMFSHRGKDVFCDWRQLALPLQ